MSDLAHLLAPELVQALEALVDERIAAAFADIQNDSQPTWMTIPESAEYARVSESTIARMLRDGRLRSTYIGRQRLVLREDLDLVRSPAEEILTAGATAAGCGLRRRSPAVPR